MVHFQLSPAPEGTEEVDVPLFLRTRPALEDSQVVELAQLAVALESTMGWPVLFLGTQCQSSHQLTFSLTS